VCPGYLEIHWKWKIMDEKRQLRNSRNWDAEERVCFHNISGFPRYNQNIAKLLVMVRRKSTKP
jgi:hypothetical protein